MNIVSILGWTKLVTDITLPSHTLHMFGFDVSGDVTAIPRGIVTVSAPKLSIKESCHLASNDSHHSIYKTTNLSKERLL